MVVGFPTRAGNRVWVCVFFGVVNLCAGLASIVSEGEREATRKTAKSYLAFGHVVGPIGLDSKVEI